MGVSLSMLLCFNVHASLLQTRNFSLRLIFYCTNYTLLASFCTLPASNMSDLFKLKFFRALSFISEKLVLVDEWSCVFPSFYPALFLLPPHGQVPSNVNHPFNLHLKINQICGRPKEYFPICEVALLQIFPPGGGFVPTNGVL